MTRGRQAVILAGGKGTRLASRLNGAPKPLVDVDGVPLLARQLRLLASYGFDRVVMLVNYRADAIRDFCALLNTPGMAVDVREDVGGERGTAGAVADVAELLDERFLVVYGDTLLDVDLDRFWNAHLNAKREQGAVGTLFLHPNDHPYDSDLVDMDDSGLIQAFHSKPHPQAAFRRNLVNAALYVLERDFLKTVTVDTGLVDFGRDLFPKALASGARLQGYVTFEYIKDVGTPDRLDKAVGDLRSGKVARCRLDRLQKAVFLDRDGTLNLPNGHIARPADLVLVPGAGKAVSRLNRAEYRCIMVTNQPVLARGECTAEGLREIHAKLETELGQEMAFLDATYICPHHPDSGFAGEVVELKRVCDCRKPAAGLLLRAMEDLAIDPALSWMVGDSAADIGAARRAGVSSLLVRTGGKVATALDIDPDYEVDDLSAAVDFILAGHAALRDLLKPVAAAILPGMLVRVAGPSRSGKSLACDVLAELLRETGLASAHLRLDRWIIPAVSRQPDQGPAGAVDSEGARHFLAGWLAGGALGGTAPCYDPSGMTRGTGPSVSLPSNGVLIVDGTLAFDPDHGIAPQARQTFDIYLETDEALRKLRFACEYRRRGLDEGAIEALYRQRMEEELPLVARQQSRADFLLTDPCSVKGKN